MKEEEKQASDLPEAASFPPPHTNRRKEKKKGVGGGFFWGWLVSSAGLKFARHSLSAVGNKGSPSVSPCGAGGGLKGRGKTIFPESSFSRHRGAAAKKVK